MWQIKCDLEQVCKCYLDKGGLETLFASATCCFRGQGFRPCENFWSAKHLPKFIGFFWWRLKHFGGPKGHLQFLWWTNLSFRFLTYIYIVCLQMFCLVQWAVRQVNLRGTATLVRYDFFTFEPLFICVVKMAKIQHVAHATRKWFPNQCKILLHSKWFSFGLPKIQTFQEWQEQWNKSNACDVSVSKCRRIHCIFLGQFLLFLPWALLGP